MSKKCTTCGREYSDDTSFCPFDGTKIENPNLNNTDAQNPNFNNQYSNPNFNMGSNQGYNTNPGFQNNYNMPYGSPIQPGSFVNGVFFYPKADLGKRFLAYLLDGVAGLVLSIPAIIVMIIMIVNATSESYTYNEYGYRYGYHSEIVGIILGSLFIFLLLMLPAIIYSFIKDGLWNGRSWGKKMMGLMVVKIDCNFPCTKGTSALRTLMSGIINCIPYLNFITFWIEPIMVLATKDGRKVADLVAKTQVINQEYYKPTQYQNANQYNQYQQNPY